MSALTNTINKMKQQGMNDFAIFKKIKFQRMKGGQIPSDMLQLQAKLNAIAENPVMSVSYPKEIQQAQDAIDSNDIDIATQKILHILTIHEQNMTDAHLSLPEAEGMAELKNPYDEENEEIQQPPTLNQPAEEPPVESSAEMQTAEQPAMEQRPAHVKNHITVLSKDTVLYHPSFHKYISDTLPGVDAPLEDTMDASKRQHFVSFFTPVQDYAIKYYGYAELARRDVYLHTVKLLRDIPIQVINDEFLTKRNKYDFVGKNICGNTINGLIEGVRVDQPAEARGAFVPEYFLCNPSNSVTITHTLIMKRPNELIEEVVV